MALARFMASPAGRGARIVLGVILVVAGISAGGAGLLLAAFGVVAIAAGAANVCLLGPLLKAPFKGSDIR